jgi:hypothetical protein
MSRTWVLTPIERSVLRVMQQAHESGMDWLGLTNVAIPIGLSLDETAAALARPVRLGYVEQHGKRGAIYQLTGEGLRIAVGAYAPGEIIRYTSFDPSGYSIGQVVRYAPDGEQTRICPNCSELTLPGDGQEDSLGRCQRCQAYVRFPALDPLVYIRTRSGGRPFQVRESQLRRHRGPAEPQADRREQILRRPGPPQPRHPAPSSARPSPEPDR